VAKGVFRRCSCGKRLPDGTRICPRPGCSGIVKWAYTVEVGRPGERKTRYRSGFNTAAEASAARARVLTELQDGLFIPPSKLTLGQYLDRWWATSPTKNWKPNTVRAYRIAIGHIKRYLGDVPIQALTSDQLKAFYARLLREGKQPRRKGYGPEPLAPKTVANVHVCLHAALRDAVNESPPLRRSNPAHDAYHYSSVTAGKELQHWTLDEMRLFLDFVESQREAGMYAVGLATGMRRGELLGLRDRDVDLPGARISVRQQWTKAGDQGWRMMPLKTGQKAWRSIDIDPVTVAVLRRQRDMVAMEREAWGNTYRDHGLVFPREDGLPQNPDHVTTRFERLIEDCPGVPRIVFHGMRHTHATLLLEDGVSIKVVAERLGDREDTVLRLYGHITPRGRMTAVASVGTWWKGGMPAAPVAPSELEEMRATIASLRELVADLQRQNDDLRSSREQSVSESPAQGIAQARIGDVSN
jgi:integrase